ncbi:signal peptidase II [Sulfurimonas sp. HSL-1716]|uniref:signal peptidase II n=1 Tax=Hydrocurvibacter sulfurireducens TaxID=3131937 RepID=UPI0031F9724C
MLKPTYKLLLPLILSIIGIFMIDQGIKEFFILKAMDMYGVPQDYLYTRALDIYQTSCINLRLVFNYGVAFSMFAFLEDSLKWIQLLLISGAFVYVVNLKKSCYTLPAGILIGAGFSNIYDRFVHGGVVDYVYWHCGFDFAIFNFADVMIDLAVLWLLLLNFKPRLCK